jgi:hypothetical protein
MHDAVQQMACGFRSTAAAHCHPPPSGGNSQAIQLPSEHTQRQHAQPPEHASGHAAMSRGARVLLLPGLILAFPPRV